VHSYQLALCTEYCHQKAHVEVDPKSRDHFDNALCLIVSWQHKKSGLWRTALVTCQKEAGRTTDKPHRGCSWGFPNWILPSPIQEILNSIVATSLVIIFSNWSKLVLTARNFTSSETIAGWCLYPCFLKLVMKSWAFKMPHMTFWQTWEGRPAMKEPWMLCYTDAMLSSMIGLAYYMVTCQALDALNLAFFNSQ
jgi:hypothetical protein